MFSPAVLAAVRARRAGLAQGAGDLVTARRLSAGSRASARLTAGLCLAVLVLAGTLTFVTANDAAVQKTFLQTALMSQSAAEITRAFGTNVIIFMATQALVMVLGLVLALARIAPGAAGRPLRWLAVAYIDMFRAMPAIIVIYLVGFGLPLTGFPGLAGLSPTSYAVLALTLTYGAYTAEVYRAGIEGVHRSQVAAARSLGFGYARTMRYVVLPQAGRRIVPPMLNNFIGLQKDTALVGVIGTIDVFTQAKIYSANQFNLSAVTVVAALFIVITIPQARLADYLVARDQRRAQGA
ncbi:polar amino acid ABC transporter permease [Streptomyces vietnamensis]|uniref:Polar amino acid ABC transporter permease n=1 Tax=Streptomyces vietnamensis TaxID=362257 RepID=A0A0B5IIE4_9ACTN|nr:polar amino acid ABC transporter permease [Streptomyces vietnamensis]